MQKAYDVIIVGCGVSGLYAALNLSRDKKILLICKRNLTLSNSALAQGGVACVYDKKDDKEEYHIADTLKAGGGTNTMETLEILAHEGPDDVRRLFDYGVEFDRRENGEIHLTLEGGHSRRRILHYKDSTGREMVEKLVYAVLQLPNVTVIDNAIMTDLKKEKDVFFSNVLLEEEHITFCAPKVILATGGIGRVYERTTNSAIATGDGISLAYNMGAEIKRLSFVQFHPTAYAGDKRECFLISEAVRGEGAYLLNENKERFMFNYDERLELAPRDVVSRSIIAESKKTGSNKFYLDITHKDAEFLKNRFPMIYKNLLIEGINITKDLIPIFPCQHYLMGGINVDKNSQTNIEGLYAVGECSHTGVHGNNRLASNSLLEALVFGRRAAEHINSCVLPEDFDDSFVFPVSDSTKQIPKGIRTEIRKIMQESHFVVRNKEAAKIGFDRIREIKELLDRGDFEVNANYCEARSLATVAYIILKEVIENDTF